MTEKAGAFGHRHVFPLDYLGMTRGAPEFLAPPHLSQVRGVIEQDVSKIGPAGEQTTAVASFPQTAVIGDLHPGPAFAVDPGEILDEGGHGLKFALQFLFHAGWIVALNARNHIVAGSLPAIVERNHIVTNGAKLRFRGVLKSDERHYARGYQTHNGDLAHILRGPNESGAAIELHLCSPSPFNLLKGFPSRPSPDVNASLITLLDTQTPLWGKRTKKPKWHTISAKSVSRIIPDKGIFRSLALSWNRTLYRLFSF
jgi:hypothetical protein